MITLTEKEKELLVKSTAEVIKQIEESLIREAELKRKRAEAQEIDDFNFKIWSYYNSIIMNYEKAIQNFNGEYIKYPFTNQDVVDLAHEKKISDESFCRLYQGTVSTQAKVIPEMTGNGVVSGSPHELDFKSWTETLIMLMRTGTQNSGISGLTTSYTPTPPATGGGVGYSGNTLVVNFQCPNGWVLIGGNTLVYVTGRKDHYSAGPPAVYISSTCTTTTPINNTTYGVGIAVQSWGGFTDAQRTSHLKGTNTASQALLDALILNSPASAPYNSPISNSLRYNLNRWLTYVDNVVTAEKDNPSPTMTSADRQPALDLQSYLKSFISTMPAGDVGLDALQVQMNNRLTVTGPAMVSRSKTQKALFYAPRISYTNMRADLQNGSLNTLLYLDKQLAKYPDPWLVNARESLWLLKNELST